MAMRRIFMKHNKENGQVAIISVMFFMILFSVVVISFMRVVVAEQRQATNNELSASALAAAESGVEDAKRILAYCKDNPAATECQVIFNINNNSCNAIIGNNVLMSTKLKANVIDVSGSKQVVVSADGNQKYQQYYTCLIIKYLTSDYTGNLTSNGKTEIIPLKFVNAAGSPVSSFPYFSISWHSNGDTGNKPVTGLDNNTNLPTLQAWKSAGNRPAVLRVELVTVPKSGFTLDQITDSARAVTLRPGTSSAGGVTTTAGGRTGVYNLDQWQQRKEPNGSQIPIIRSDCTSASQIYACWQKSFTIGGSNSFDLVNNDYYLRVQAIYNNTDFKVTANDSTGATLYFNGIQPSVDVTGRASDAFKRLSSRLKLEVITDDSTMSWWPEYALESGDEICKDLTVQLETGVDNCTY